MADEKSGQHRAETTRATQPSGGGTAGESSDPAVHKALADLENARMNDDKDAEKAAQKALSDLGVDAG